MEPVASSSSNVNPRPQAGPLPSKRGEIGYVESENTQCEEHGSSPEVVLPERHPADRDNPSVNRAATDPLPTPPASGLNTSLVSPSTSTLVFSESENSTKKRKVLLFFKKKKIPSVYGVSTSTLFALFLQLIVIGGTITGWALLAKFFAKQTDVLNMTAIFVHVIFGVTLLAQLLFLERRIYRLRAERYSYLHPGEILPSSRNFRSRDPTIAFSPWNRPPLPTYAAALAQSGVGTGDVEDHLIAAPPPPAYGNTRGSTLLLSGFLRDSLRAQRPPSRRSEMSHHEDRPASYASRDEEWDTIQDADRARRLEETLSQLERPISRI